MTEPQCDEVLKGEVNGLISCIEGRESGRRADYMCRLFEKKKKKKAINMAR